MSVSYPRTFAKGNEVFEYPHPLCSTAPYTGNSLAERVQTSAFTVPCFKSCLSRGMDCRCIHFPPPETGRNAQVGPGSYRDKKTLSQEVLESPISYKNVRNPIPRFTATLTSVRSDITVHIPGPATARYPMMSPATYDLPRLFSEHSHPHTPHSARGSGKPSGESASKSPRRPPKHLGSSMFISQTRRFPEPNQDRKTLAQLDSTFSFEKDYKWWEHSHGGSVIPKTDRFKAIPWVASSEPNTPRGPGDYDTDYNFTVERRLKVNPQHYSPSFRSSIDRNYTANHSSFPYPSPGRI
eukprot:TRINITY_DN4509_c0_g1::TRINITY_DN4509_c0_g1_i1::g.23175::m.23175 TRINITY_DN4509_c0_g1::TRINITY_DN4509_c0_g1_i1::g.23175  ORF type:complete len:312 (-),score=30.08 TRINITY_DN4509_c0_g1_i1:342-1229(-)